MVPRTILRQLGRLRQRERLIRLAWGAARWLAVVVTLLVIACAIDWFIDRRRETPWELRRAMLYAQLVAGGMAALLLIVRPLVRRMSDSRLALWVEERVPEFGHRLISAVQ